MKSLRLLVVPLAWMAACTCGNPPAVDDAGEPDAGRPRFCNPACGEGQRCFFGECVCDARSCPGGCCNGTTCVPARDQSAALCGPDGGVCGTCSGLTPTCSAGACTDGCGPGQGTCAGGCCQAGHCAPGGADNACGSAGGDCVDCTGSQVGALCVSGRCGCNADRHCPGDGGTCDLGANQCACGPANCSGCCDPASGACVTPGAGACGANGTTCQPCAAGQLCTAAGSCACDATSCPNGCCNGATCVPFTSQSGTSCGTGGLACAACAAGQACAGGSCVCNAASCPGGCCSQDTCIPFASQTNGSCGAGAACAACGSGQRCAGGLCVCDATSCAGGCCDAAGACQPGSGAAACGTAGAACAACGAGQRCQGGACICDSTSCAAGCCDAAGSCQAGGATGACGNGGSACVACAAGQACAGGSCVCNAASCPSGCCNGNTCVPTSAQANGQCGTGGASCASCSGLAPTCAGGACTAACGSAGQGTCTGGCCGGGTCRGGTGPSTCGTTGGTCTDCTAAAAGHACVAGRCGCGSTADCPAGSTCNPVTQTCGTCNATTCPTGCCDSNGTCQAGSTAAACGAGGAACLSCATAQACVGGSCVCNGASCPTGCCSGTSCVGAGSQSAAQCGTGGAMCSSCAANPQGTGCVLGGCGCTTAADCPAGSACNGSTGRCVAGGSCASGPCNGCCAGGLCTAGASATTCGAGGGACADCVATQPQCRSGATCSAGSCQYTTSTSGACELGFCTVGEACDATGTCSGGTPRDCTGGNACLACSCSNAGAGMCSCTPRAASAGSALNVTSSCLTAGTQARLVAVLNLVDAAGLPLTGATVTFTAPGATWVEAQAVEAPSPPGTYYRTLIAPAAATTVTVGASVAACSATTPITQTRTVTVAAAAPATGFGGAAFQGVGGCSPVAGHVRVKVIAEETGLPISGASVLVGLAEGTPLVATAAALFPTAAPAGSNVATTNAQGVVELVDFGSTLRGPLTVTASATGRALVTYRGWNGADQIIALPLRRPSVVQHAYAGNATSLPSKTSCSWVAVGFALQDTPLDALGRFDLNALMGPNKCVDSGLGGLLALPENIYTPAQSLGFLCLGTIVESQWRLDVKPGQRVLDMPYAQIPVSAAQNGTLVDMIQGAQFLELGYQQVNATGPVPSSIFNLNNTYPNSVTFNYSNQPAQTDLTAVTVLDYDGTGVGRLGIAGINIDKYTDASPVVVRVGNLTGAPAGTRFLGAVVASYYTSEVPGRTIPADRDSAKSTAFVRGTLAAPPFGPGANASVTVNNFLGISPAVVSGGTTFSFGDAANAGQVPQYSISTLSIEHTVWRARLSACESANDPSKVVSHHPQWLVYRPRTTPTTTCPGFMSTVTGCETFSLPTLPATFAEAAAGLQKQSGFEQRIGSAAACTGTCAAPGETCVVPINTTLPSQCMGTDANGSYFTERYAWTLENRALGLAPTAITASSADLTQWKPGLTQLSSNTVGF